MLDKIKANLNYVLCAFLGMFHFVMMSFDYISAFWKYDGERESEGIFNGYQMMKFEDFEGCEAEGLAVFNGILQILLLIVAVGLLLYGAMGLLKAFGQFNEFPSQIAGKDSNILAGFGLLAYAGISFLLFVLMLIWAGANTETVEWGGEKYKSGICVGFGMYFALIFGGLLAAAPFVLPQFVSGLNEETSGGPQISYRCAQCGKKASKTEKFCNACGGNIVAEVVKQYNYVCSGCGKKMKKTDKFCNVCGGAVEAVEVKHMEYVCGGCGKKMKKTDKFCNVCGGTVVEREIAPAAPAAPVAAAPVVEGPVCPNCGKPIAEGQRFCTGCGTTL